MQSINIWSPVEYHSEWNSIKTERFDIILPSWERKRADLSKEPDQYERFIDQLKRKQAIDTGIIEQLYDLKRGVTETFIREGFVDSYLQHGDSDISPSLLMNYLRDNYDAIDFIFDFVKNNREMSVSYIKELHHLITQHQESTEVMDSMGRYVRIELLKGEFKRNPNNPVRDGIVYSYCPPEQVASEMEQLISIFNTELGNAHVLVKAAFLHHAFVQIHPFQDGNGRIARLLTSFVLIREGLFPFSMDRDDRNRYIDALEQADKYEYQPLVDIISANQIASIERALNWQTVISTAGYDSILNTFEKKLQEYHIAETVQRNNRVRSNLFTVYSVMCEQMEHFKNDLQAKLGDQARISSSYCEPDNPEAYYYQQQIIEFAKTYDYYANLSLDKCWGRLFIEIDKTKAYRLIVSLHHYGYDNSTFAIGSILSKAIFDPEGDEKEYMDIPLGLPPLTMSSEKAAQQLTSSIKQQVETSIMVALTYIANELG